MSISLVSFFSHSKLILASLFLLLGLCACEEAQEQQHDQDIPQLGPWTIAKTLPNEGAILNVFGNDQITMTVGGQPEQGRLWFQTKDMLDWQEDLTVPSGALLNWGSMLTISADQHLIWLVGSGGRILRKKGMLSTAIWEEIPSPTKLDLWGVWAYDDNEAWAVGGNAADENSQIPALIKWNGQAWENIELPELDRAGMRALFKVFGVGKWVFAVGMKGVIIGAQRDEQGQLGPWQQFKVNAKENSIPSTEDLISLWGISDDQIAAVGGRSNGVLVKWDGQAWTSLLLNGIPGLNGIWMDSQGKSHVVGIRGAILSFDPFSWQGVRQRTDTTLVLHSIWGNGNQRWSVGGSLDDAPPWEGIILNQK
jgi:hypothetical protein